MTSTSHTTRKKIVVPILVIGLGILGLVGMIAARPKVETRAPEVQPPLIRVVETDTEDMQLRVSAQGSVAPRTESSLVPEVSGRVEWVATSLAPGGFFEEGDVLLRIERRDAEVALRQAEAARARAASEALLARANLKRSLDLSTQGVVSSAELDTAKNNASVAEAMLLEADTRIEQARTDLERTEIVAPFAGRVRDKMVDVGQFVNRGATVATIYSVDFAEVRLPIPDDQLAYVDLPLHYRGENGQPAAQPRVLLRARIAGQEHQWEGAIVRTEGEIDPRSRMVHAVAQVADPYARDESARRPPLAVGLFVEAEIFGRTVHDVIVLPRSAIRGDDRVLVVENATLRFRDVEVLRAEREHVIVSAGLRPGELVAVSPIEAAVDGMRVRIAEQSDEQVAVK
jgi:RND family efflux transporter MFP subunit